MRVCISRLVHKAFLVCPQREHFPEETGHILWPHCEILKRVMLAYMLFALCCKFLFHINKYYLITNHLHQNLADHEIGF